MRRSVYLYVGGCCVLAALAAAAVAAVAGPGSGHLWLAPVLVVVLLLELAQDVRQRHRGRQSQSIGHDESYFVAAAFLLHPLGIVAGLGLAMLVADVWVQDNRLKTVFNVAKSVSAASSALLLMHALGGLGSLTPRGVATAAAGGLVFVVLNDLLVAGVVSLAAREPFRVVVFDGLRGRFVVWSGNISVGILAGLSAAHDLRLLPFALVAMVALHFALWGHARARSERDRSQERERLLQAILDSEPHCVTLVEADGTISFVNPAGTRLLHAASGGDVIGRRWHDVATAESGDAVTALLTAGFQGVAQRRELRVSGEDGLQTLESTTAPLVDEYGDVVSLVMVSRDITRQRLLEEQLRRAQKMEAVGQLAGGVAHDFNNLLTAIAGYSDLALDQLPREAQAARADIAEIQRATARAAELTRRLLAFSRREVLHPRAFDLNRTIEEVESLLRRLLGEHIEIETSLDAAGCPMVADPAQIEQVLVNLALNARDAMPDGGRLRIATDNVGTTIRLSVSDTGFGMDADTRDRIFEPFFTTKEPGKGTGLGLAMVFGIVEESGGRIEVDSEPGAGTRFVLAFERSARPLDTSRRAA